MSCHLYIKRISRSSSLTNRVMSIFYLYGFHSTQQKFLQRKNCGGLGWLWVRVHRLHKRIWAVFSMSLQHKPLKWLHSGKRKCHFFECSQNGVFLTGNYGALERAHEIQKSWKEKKMQPMVTCLLLLWFTHPCGLAREKMIMGRWCLWVSYMFTPH